MRIWFRINSKAPGERGIFDGDVECRIRLHERDDDIVFHARCQDEGMAGIMVDLLNTKLGRAIEEGDLVASTFLAPRVGSAFSAPKEDQEDT